MREGLAVAAAEGVDIPAEEADHILQKVTKGERRTVFDVLLQGLWLLFVLQEGHNNENAQGDRQQTREQDFHVRRCPQEEVLPQSAIFIAQLIISTEVVLRIPMTYDNHPIPKYGIEDDLSLLIYLSRPPMT